MEIKINEVTYSYTESGQGQTILLLHGFTGSKETWGNLIKELELNFHVIAIDLLGHGETGAPIDDERYKMEYAAKDLSDFLIQKQIDSVHLLGYSMGGRLALYFALAYPAKISSLILESCTAGLNTERERLARIEQDTKLSAMILNDGIETFVNYWENVPLFSTQKNLPTSSQEEIKKGRLNQSPIGLSNSLIGMGTGIQPSLWDDLNQFHKTTLLVCGEYDEKFCLIMGKMNEKLKNSEIIKIPHAGHAIHVEQLKKFATIVSGFLLEKEKEKIS
ncbi:2-succinyl-6-hydroxy-2,4-cyclohexadiene-1-carboxylate synthase [Gottfriedia sp. NPDC056225]|uniref:2-succinyl-6-hydroxy-2, 4-cyclohexadiene-1-carboxylate synthase n=1 Tax=Gottfriedia sp. NPDC056225 TaxID=3345751 RepID=UPI0035E24ECD